MISCFLCEAQNRKDGNGMPLAVYLQLKIAKEEKRLVGAALAQYEELLVEKQAGFSTLFRLGTLHGTHRGGEGNEGKLDGTGVPHYERRSSNLQIRFFAYGTLAFAARNYYNHNMKNRQPKIFYRRNLPHYQPPDGTFFITFRLAGSLPKEVIGRMKEERDDYERWVAGIPDTADRVSRWRDYQSEYFEKFDSLLDGDTNGPLWLREPRIASLVADSLQFYNGSHYDMIAYVIMPNHVHVACTLLRGAISQEHLASGEPSAPYVLTTILQSIKKYTARQANKALGRSGNFWQQESYDHTIRTAEELQRTVYYVINNPVKANLCDSWDQWQWTYVKEGLL